MNRNRYFAEGFATFTLVFTGCGAIMVNDTYGGTLGTLGVNLVFGLVVMAMVYSVGNVSGAHINPAVTLGFFFAGRFEKKQVLPYIACQVAGAIVASSVLWVLLPVHDNMGATLPADSLLRAFAMEVVLTFLLMSVILNVSTGHMEKGIMAGVAVGGMVALEGMVGGPVSGASMNPARSLGPALVAGQFHALWIYLVAPVLGALLAAPTFRLIQGNESQQP